MVWGPKGDPLSSMTKSPGELSSCPYCKGNQLRWTYPKSPVVFSTQQPGELEQHNGANSPVYLPARPGLCHEGWRSLHKNK